MIDVQGRPQRIGRPLRYYVERFGGYEGKIPGPFDEAVVPLDLSAYQSMDLDATYIEIRWRRQDPSRVEATVGTPTPEPSE